MLSDLHMLVFSVALCWLMLMFASLYRARAWTPDGLQVAFGNRESQSEATPLAGRADRAAKNMLENLLLFTALLTAAHLNEGVGHRTHLGANLFFWARVVYWPVYLAGIPYLRTLVWAVSVVGLVMIARAAF